jgi:hypothetical protein
MITIFKIVGYSAIFAIVIFFTVLIYRGITARKEADLEPWHNIPLLEDNLARTSYNDFSKYLAEESQFLATIQKDVNIEKINSFNRYASDNKSSPYVDGDN